MKTLINLFNLGMDRQYPEPRNNILRTHRIINLGPGNKHIRHAIEFDLPEWDAETMPIPLDDNTVAIVHCYHFLEHIANTCFILSEIERVLVPGGHVNIVVPYYNSSMQAQDPDHKAAFTENTWKVIFDSSYYTKDKVKPMDIHLNFIMGDCEKNLCLVTQLVKL